MTFTTKTAVADIAAPEVRSARVLQADQKSYWYGDSDDRIRYPALAGVRRTQLAIVGGGIAALNIARMAAEDGVDSVLLTAGRIAGGATSQMGAIHTRVPDEGWSILVDHYGPERAKTFIEEMSAGHAEMIELAQSIGADYHDGKFYMVSFEANDPGLRAEFDVLKGNDPLTSFISDPEEARWILPGATTPPQSALVMHNEGRMNPRKLALGIASRLPEVHEDSQVIGIKFGDPGKPVEVYTEHGVVKADRVVFATNSPVAPFEDTISVPAQCFATALLVPIDQMPLGGWSNNLYPSYDYGRVLSVSADGRTATVLMGGGARWLGEESAESQSAMLDERIQRFYPGAIVREAWTGTINISPDGFPTLDSLPADKRVSAATRLGGSGLDFSQLLARVYVSSQLHAGENILSSDRFNSPA